MMDSPLWKKLKALADKEEADYGEGKAKGSIKKVIITRSPELAPAFSDAPPEELLRLVIATICMARPEWAMDAAEPGEMPEEDEGTGESEDGPEDDGDPGEADGEMLDELLKARRELDADKPDLDAVRSSLDAVLKGIGARA